MAVESESETESHPKLTKSGPWFGPGETLASLVTTQTHPYCRRASCSPDVYHCIKGQFELDLKLRRQREDVPRVQGKGQRIGRRAIHARQD